MNKVTPITRHEWGDFIGTLRMMEQAGFGAEYDTWPESLVDAQAMLADSLSYIHERSTLSTDPEVHMSVAKFFHELVILAASTRDEMILMAEATQ